MSSALSVSSVSSAERGFIKRMRDESTGAIACRRIISWILSVRFAVIRVVILETARLSIRPIRFRSCRDELDDMGCIANHLDCMYSCAIYTIFVQLSFATVYAHASALHCTAFDITPDAFPTKNCSVCNPNTVVFRIPGCSHLKVGF